MFIFDEPTTGLHFHDIRKLLDAFDALIRRGHSIVIIEHNMDAVSYTHLPYYEATNKPLLRIHK